MQYPFILGRLAQRVPSQYFYFLCRFIPGLIGITANRIPLASIEANAGTPDSLTIRSRRPYTHPSGFICMVSKIGFLLAFQSGFS
jgi:hypothetical protein